MLKSTQNKLCDIIAGYLEYVTIEKRLGTLDMEKMELVYRRQEITKLQSEIIKELKTIDTKLDENILQKCRLEKRKLQLLPIIEPPVTCLPKLNTPITSPNKSQCETTIQKPSPTTSCVIRKALKRSPTLSNTPSKVRKELFSKGEMSDNDLLAALANFDHATSK